MYIFHSPLDNSMNEYNVCMLYVVVALSSISRHLILRKFTAYEIVLNLTNCR